MLHLNGKRQQRSYWSLCKLAIENCSSYCREKYYPVHCLFTITASVYLCPVTCSFRIWLQSAVLTVTVLSAVYSTSTKKKKSAHHFLIPWPRSVCCASLDPSHTHHSNPPVWLSGCLSCICLCHNTWVIPSINNLISAWENQKLYEVGKKRKNYIMCLEGRVPFSKREVIRQLKMVVTWSFEVNFQTSFPYIQAAHTIITDPTPPVSMAA